MKHLILLVTFLVGLFQQHTVKITPLTLLEIILIPHP